MSDSPLAKAFAGIKQVKPERPRPQAVKSAARQKPKAGPRITPPPAAPTGKRNDPEYVAVKVFLKRKTHKAASRRWEDGVPVASGIAGGDFSDLVEMLLKAYLDTAEGKLWTIR